MASTQCRRNVAGRRGQSGCGETVSHLIRDQEIAGAAPATRTIKRQGTRPALRSRPRSMRFIPQCSTRREVCSAAKRTTAFSTTVVRPADYRFMGVRLSQGGLKFHGDIGVAALHVCLWRRRYRGSTGMSPKVPIVLFRSGWTQKNFARESFWWRSPVVSGDMAGSIPTTGAIEVPSQRRDGETLGRERAASSTKRKSGTSSDALLAQLVEHPAEDRGIAVRGCSGARGERRGFESRH